MSKQMTIEQNIERRAQIRVQINKLRQEEQDLRNQVLAEEQVDSRAKELMGKPKEEE
jgi:hypothetical protein